MTVRSGPLPDPEMLAGYERVLKGAADRVFKMAETEQHERHLMAYREQRLKSFTIVLGQFFAFTIGICGVVGGIYLVLKDKPLGGFTVFFTSLASLVGIYLSNVNKHQQEPKLSAKI